MITCSSVDVTFKDEDASRVLDSFTEGALLLLDLHDDGSQRRRAAVLDTLVQPHVATLAALAGRRSLPSPASLSRALDAVEPSLMREHDSWLLSGAANAPTDLRQGRTCFSTFTTSV